MSHPTRPIWLLGITSGLLATLATGGGAAALTVGMVVDNGGSTGSPALTAFDADDPNHFDFLEYIAMVGHPAIEDCVIDRNQTLGFVADSEVGGSPGRVWVVDLTLPPPSIIPAPTPIAVSNSVQDISITPDQKFLLTCGPGPWPISVIDIASRTEMLPPLPVGQTCSAIEACSDGSVLVASSPAPKKGQVKRFTINDLGALLPSSDVMKLDAEPANVFCAPDGNSGVVIGRGTQQLVQSFTLPTLTKSSKLRLDTSGNSAISGQINPTGDLAYIRGNGGPQFLGEVEAYSYNASTGALGNRPLFMMGALDAPAIPGTDQIVLTPDGSRLFVSQPGAVHVHDAATGEFLYSFVGELMNQAVGVCFPAP